MLKNRFKDEILQPSDTVKKIRGKARLYLIFWGVLLVVSGLVYWASSFTVVDLPTLSSIAKSSPISFKLVMNSSSAVDGALSGFSSINDVMGTTMKYVFILMLVIGGFAFAVSKNIMVVAMMIMTSVGAIIVVPTILDANDSRGIDSSVSSDFGEYVKSGNVKGYLESIEKYSARGGFILNNVIESKAVNQDDARNLLDVFSKNDAQKVTVGLAETLTNAISNGDGSLNESKHIVSALSAYVLSSVERDANEPVIDSRTGFAIFDTAKELKNFAKSNIYSDEVKAKVTSQAKVRAFLLNTSAILLALGFVFFWLWGFSFRNVNRAEKVFIEEAKLRNIS